MKRPLAWWIASGGGSGLAPAPGTAGSLVALFPGAALLWFSPLALLAASAAAVCAGLWAIPRAGGSEDPDWVVIDEFAGQWIALLGLTRFSSAGVLLGLALFRLLDIAKPGPIGWADRQPGAGGVMGDDILAGVGAAVLLWGVRHLWPAPF